MTLSTTAQILLDSYDRVRSVSANSVPATLSLEEAAQIQSEIIEARSERGERTAGYKIGFTNRTIWAQYGVHHPIWAPVYDTTLTLLSDDQTAEVSAAKYVEPRLEPEIVICLNKTPTNATPAAVAKAIDWVAHGFEIVQSAYPGWRFTGAQSFAAQGLHGALLVGKRCPISEFGQVEALPEQLSKISLRLYKDSDTEPTDQGTGSNALDGPIHALGYLVSEMAKRNTILQPGAIITTGTLTDAQPLAAGQHWHSELKTAGPLAGLHLSVRA